MRNEFVRTGLSWWVVVVTLMAAVVGLAACKQGDNSPVGPPVGRLAIEAFDCHGEVLPLCRLVLQRVTQELPADLPEDLTYVSVVSERAAEAATDSTGRQVFSALKAGYYHIVLTAPLPQSGAPTDCGGGAVEFIRVAADSVSQVTVRQVDTAAVGVSDRIRWQPRYLEDKGTE